MIDTVEQAFEDYFLKGEEREHVLENKRKTIAFVRDNIGNLTMTNENGHQQWSASLLGGQNIGDACLAAYYLTSASKIPVQFDANGTRFLIAEIEKNRN